MARAEGLDVTGPIAPDTVFRHLTHRHQNLGLVGNCALFLGTPYLFMSVGHGTAYDIVGKGIANHEMILAAILPGASLASGRGFLSQ